MIKQLKCPQCRVMVAWHGNPHRPFCSERCRLIDLGQWADESYTIPGPLTDSFSDENDSQLNDVQQDDERS